MIELEGRRAIGIADLYCIRRQHKTGNIGLMIGEAEYWGKGYGTETIQLLLDFAFDKLGLNKVCMATVEYNERLVRSAEKCGFFIEGRKRQQRMHDEQYYDEIDMGVLRTEYSELRQQWRNQDT